MGLIRNDRKAESECDLTGIMQKSRGILREETENSKIDLAPSYENQVSLIISGKRKNPSN